MITRHFAPAGSHQATLFPQDTELLLEQPPHEGNALAFSRSRRLPLQSTALEMMNDYSIWSVF